MRVLGDRARRFLLPGLIALTILTALFALGMGAVKIPPGEVFDILRAKAGSLFGGKATSGDVSETIVISLRLPRTILAALTGASLSLSGAVYQAIFRNPMADPYVMGASSGASLGATCAFLLPISLGFLGLGSVPLLAFLGSLLAVAVVYNISKVGDRTPILSLLLSGIIVNAVLSSAVSLISFIAAKQELLGLLYWLMGGFSGKHWDYVLASLPYFALGIAVILFHGRDLNALLLGDEEALRLGVEVQKVTRTLVVAASLLTASAVASGGIIGFVGLIVPHLVRMLIGPDHRRLIPSSVFLGATTMMGADIAARLVMPPRELPVGIVTALLGGPFFMYLLRRYRTKVW